MRRVRGGALVLRIARLSEQLEGLREGRLPKSSALDRIWDQLDADGTIGELSALTALTAVLDRIGLQTVAEARLLRRHASRSERWVALAGGLDRRCERACRELERAARRAFHLHRVGTPMPGAGSFLIARLRELQRVVRIAGALAEEGGAEETSGAPLPATGGDGGGARGEGEASGSGLDAPRRPPLSARLTLARFFTARADRTLFDAPRRQRELDLAHAVLMGADSGEDRHEVMALRWQIAQQRARASGARDGEADAAAPTGPDALLREVRRCSTEDPPRAWRMLHQLSERATHAGRPVLAEAGLHALEALVPEPSRLREALERRLEEARPDAQVTQLDARLGPLLRGLTPQRARLLELARGCARYFDVGDGFTEEIEVEEAAPVAARPRQVQWSTQRLDFETTGNVERVHDFVIDDPRRILHDLASHRQVVRTWLEEAPRPGPRSTRRSSVRVYVCDASGSMHGARARFRDAILISELDAMLARVADGAPLDPLYYCYFNDRPSTLLRVEDEDDVLRHLERLFGATPALGPTNITLALTSAIDAVVQARSRDPELGRATVVLVTDGEDRVDVDFLERARKPLEGLPVALSLISLGRENPDLRRLARSQRAQGERAFYAHLDDAELIWARTAFQTPLRLLLPEELPPALEVEGQGRTGSIDPDALERRLVALERVARDEDARVEGLKPLPAAPGDFDRLFPDAPPPVPARSAEDLERVLSFLEAIEAVTALIPPEARQSECVRLLEHLCGAHGLQRSDWLSALGAAGERARPGLRRLRLLARPFRG